MVVAWHGERPPSSSSSAQGRWEQGCRKWRTSQRWMLGRKYCVREKAGRVAYADEATVAPSKLITWALAGTALFFHFLGVCAAPPMATASSAFRFFLAAISPA